MNGSFVSFLLQLVGNRTLALLSMLAIATVIHAADKSEATSLIAVASNMQPAMQQIQAQFQREPDSLQTGKPASAKLRIVYGASGNFVSQVLQGAPIALLLAADEQSIERLHAAGRSEDGGVVYASGRLALFVPQQSLALWQPDAAMQGLRQALQRQQIQRFAIANPELAPYGRAAREALQAVGLWQSIQSRLVLGENIAQAGQFASGGSTQGGILALSLALTPALQQRGRHVVLPASLHQPIHQRMALMRGAGEPARALYRYLQQPAAQAILLAHGYAVPGADAAKATP
jgi:molybdate transport system substrate-binding protein